MPWTLGDHVVLRVYGRQRAAEEPLKNEKGSPAVGSDGGFSISFCLLFGRWKHRGKQWHMLKLPQLWPFDMTFGWPSRFCVENGGRLQEASFEQLGFSPVLGPVDIGPSRQRSHPPACLRDALWAVSMMALIFSWTDMMTWSTWKNKNSHAKYYQLHVRYVCKSQMFIHINVNILIWILLTFTYASISYQHCTYFCRQGTCSSSPSPWAPTNCSGHQLVGVDSPLQKGCSGGQPGSRRNWYAAEIEGWILGELENHHLSDLSLFYPFFSQKACC